MDDAMETYCKFREALPGNIRIALRDPDPVLTRSEFRELGIYFKTVAMFNEDTGVVAMRLVDTSYRGWTLDMMIESAARELGV